MITSRTAVRSARHLTHCYFLARRTTAALRPNMAYITSRFDSGNIEVVECSNPADIQLRIKPDPYCDVDKAAHFQWFNFTLTGLKDKPSKLRIINAGQASYPPAWHGYHACASYDLQEWFRLPATAYNEEAGELTIEITPEQYSVRIAYFAPYTLHQHDALVARTQCSPLAQLHILGSTLDGRPLEMLQIGQPGPGKRSVWIIARQHPGESMAEWFMEGLLARLTSSSDAVARKLLQGAVIYAVPNMNPDGSVRGHLRTNAAGANLNREWASPSAATSPEVLATKAKMQATGVDMLVDVHGDEELPYCFIAGNEGIPSWSPRLKTLQEQFCAAFCAATPDFQTQHGYAVSAPGKANMTLCSKAVGAEFDCLSVTLEMPFKDAANNAEPLRGWSPERAKQFGADMLTAVLHVVPMLRE